MRAEATVWPINLDEPMPEIDISRASAIHGWMSEIELVWLGKVARTHWRIAEVGSFMGRSTRILGENTPGYVMAFDDFQGSRESYISPANKIWGERIKDSILPEFKRNLADLIEQKKVDYHQCDHANIRLLDFFDMVFIDGDHEYENVKRDLLFWRERLAPGGLLCGHDAYEKGVIDALKDVIGETITVGDTSIWIV